ncbi:hypothetical protein BH20ACT16_BH20ACT16_12340 [soil metagenome]|jgi:hypothetical protein
MPVTSVGTTTLPGSGATPAASAAAPPPVAATPSSGVVGHGVTRLKARPPAHALNPPFIPGTPPPRGETAGAHGAHKGRISIR